MTRKCAPTLARDNGKSNFDSWGVNQEELCTMDSIETTDSVTGLRDQQRAA